MSEPRHDNHFEPLAPRVLKYDIAPHTHPERGEVLPIRIFPDPILRKRAHPIQRIDPKIAQLASDMLMTMVNAQGTGLAGPQVGVLKRIVTVHVPEGEPLALINPEIETKRGKRTVIEGCLSLPGYTGLVERAVRVTARYINTHGDRFRVSANELLAQAIEHEIDHLNGIMYLDHLKAHEDLAREGITHHDPHWHDVGYTIHVDHADHARAGGRDREMVEVLKSTAKLSKLNSEARLDDATYDLEG